jgi:hypothetical protein
MLVALLPLLAVATDRGLDADDLTRRRERVDPGAEVGDFDPGDADLRLYVAFVGDTPGPQSIVTAFFDWFEVGAAFDLGVARLGQGTVGLGLETFVARPWIAESVAPLVSEGGADLRWRAASRGVVARATWHYTGFSALDPYVVALAGPTADVIRVFDRAAPADGRFRSGGLRFGGGAGVSTVDKQRILAAFELRYLGAPRFRRPGAIDLTDADGATVDTALPGRAQRPPAGFGWVASIGVRL